MKKNLTLLFLISFITALQGAQGGSMLENEQGGLKNEKQIAKVIQLGILEDKELLSFLEEIKTTITTHNWSAFIGLCSNEHYKAQVNDNRMSSTQYIAEAIGVHNHDNSIFEEGESKVDMKVLEKIESLKFLTIKKHYNEVVAEGIITLKSGKNLTIKIEILYDKDDGYIISGALG
ncbi:MAG: hypothetical protein JXQ76_08265 [Campylobacterales bacterium]|nr:hypothetical protein [Campylobacterales bacterium]